MVDELSELPELPVNPDSSQSLFDSSQSVLQSPPVEISHKKCISKKMIAGLVGGLILLVIILYAILSGNNQDIDMVPEVVGPSPTPVVRVEAKEAELKRVEKIVEQANPENLLILPPQVDMEISF